LVERFSRAYEAEAGQAPRFGYSGYGDPNLFSTVAGIPTVMFGPRGGNFHAAGEWTELPTIVNATRVLIRLASDLMPR
jgi:acetylornithine deacetylase/succinyl-diaminopimelate desuccinylase-like protein